MLGWEVWTKTMNFVEKTKGCTLSRVLSSHQTMGSSSPFTPWNHLPLLCACEGFQCKGHPWRWRIWVWDLALCLFGYWVWKEHQTWLWAWSSTNQLCALRQVFSSLGLNFCIWRTKELNGVMTNVISCSSGNSSTGGKTHSFSEPTWNPLGGGHMEHLVESNSEFKFRLRGKECFALFMSLTEGTVVTVTSVIGHLSLTYLIFQIRQPRHKEVK